VKLVFSPEADQDVERVDSWWRENRRDAPNLFAEELAAVCRQILRTPLIFKPCCERDGVSVRRRLLGKTEQWVYYQVDMEMHEVVILRVWGACRKRGPKL